MIEVSRMVTLEGLLTGWGQKQAFWDARMFSNFLWWWFHGCVYCVKVIVLCP